MTEIAFIDDRQQWYFEKDGVQPRALDYQCKRVGGDAYKALIQLKQTQKVDKIRLYVIELPKIVELTFPKAQTAQGVEFTLNCLDTGCEIDVGGSTFKAIFYVRRRMLVEHRLHHGKFIEICIQ